MHKEVIKFLSNLSNNHDFILFNNEQKGIFITILCHILNSKNMKIQNNSLLLSKICSTSLNIIEENKHIFNNTILFSNEDYITITNEALSNENKYIEIKQSDIINVLDTHEVDNIENQEGFILSNILLKNNISCLFDTATSEERSTIWGVGVDLLKIGAFTEDKVRAFLGKQIHTYGEKLVVEAIAKLSIQKMKPADAKAYLIGTLKQDFELLQKEEKKTQRRSQVSI